MKKIFLGLICSMFLLTGCNSAETFYLEDKYYGDNEFIDLDEDTLNDLVEEQESFAIFIYQPDCANSENFEAVLTEYMQDKQISIYKMAYSDMKETFLGDDIKYYPSLVILHEGQVVDFLDANSDSDTDYYKSSDNFHEWFSSYVLLKDVTETSNEENENEETVVLTDVTVEDLSYDQNKINIYFFWGDGCPHCAEEEEFFASIADEYGDYYTLNAFEVWNNEENAEIFSAFAAAMGDEVSGVPYTIIGDESFIGFSEDKEEEMLNAIKNNYKNSYDVYFDSIKKD